MAAKKPASKKKWAQDVELTGTSLRSVLGTKKGQNIPKSKEKEILKKPVGSSVQSGGKSVPVTAKLKQKVLFATNVAKKKKGKK